MALNRINITINSRQYTVVAEEEIAYMERLCAHINEKVDSVLEIGKNVMGERPIVLAALNICDEYYKALEANEALRFELEVQKDKNKELAKSKTALQDEIDMLENGQISIDEAAMEAEVKSAKSDLEDANTRIKFLEGQVKLLEKQFEEQKNKVSQGAAQNHNPQYNQKNNHNQQFGQRFNGKDRR